MTLPSAYGILPGMNTQLQNRFAHLGLAVPEILLPRAKIDVHKWAVIACDQHTSEPDYWEEVASVVGDAPSTLNLVFPEVYLETGDAGERIQAIHAEMSTYLQNGILEAHGPGLVLVRRTTPYVSTRSGIMAAVDLEHYDYSAGATTLIRASERTILERLPPRVRIREGAPIELPHVLVLYNDPENRVLTALRGLATEPLYQTSLMLGGGSVSGTLVADGDRLEAVAAAFESLLLEQTSDHPLLFAVGDGNHSLAAAKMLWDRLCPDAPADHPARWALVELVNLYDPGLRFEPIHRIVSGVEPGAFITAMAHELGATVEQQATDQIGASIRQPDRVGFMAGTNRDPYSGVLQLPATGELPVAAVQEYLNAQAETADVDYIHGFQTARQLAGAEGRVSLVMPQFDPSLLYPTVMNRGVLPRKAFSLGEAEEKRYYLEARRIVAG
jgi:hypothetical protein